MDACVHLSSSDVKLIEVKIKKNLGEENCEAHSSKKYNVFLCKTITNLQQSFFGNHSAVERYPERYNLKK